MNPYHDAIYDFLRLESGQTLGKMWGNIERLRRLGLKYADLPATAKEFQSGLEELLAAGLAERCGELWLCVPVKRQPVVEPKTERMLFA